LVFCRLKAVLRKRHPFLLGEVAVDEILGGDVDLADAVVGLLRFVAVAAEDPEGRKDQAHARDAGEEQTLAAADCVIGTEIARQRGNSLFGAALAAAVERTATALQEIGKSHILTFP
jgi:hypothetical protein